MPTTDPTPPSGPTPWLLLPGLMCDHAFWQPLLDRLPAGQPARVVDYGDADTITAMAQAALAQAPERFALLGHSMGGRVALELMRLAPQRVTRLVLMDTGYKPFAGGDAGAAERTGRLHLVDLARREGVRAMCAEWVRGMVHPERLGDAALQADIYQMFERKSAERFARQQQALLARPDAAPVLQSLVVPTLILCGRQDSWSGVAQHEAMAALAPLARLAIIEDAGHMVLMERPDATARALLEFLS